MKILKSEFIETNLGLSLETENLKILFGNKKSSIESLKKEYPDLHFQRIKQTHSDLTVQSSDEVVEADGHYTSVKKNALLISTADCLPVLLFCSETNRVASIHAGWKGVANQIVPKTLYQLIESGSKSKRFQIWIGPHILQSSFEIDLDVMKQLEAATQNLSLDQYSYEQNSKFHVNLKKIVLSQIEKITSPSNKDVVVHYLDVNTKTNFNFWSYRRDKEEAGRNLSFITHL